MMDKEFEDIQEVAQGMTQNVTRTSPVFKMTPRKDEPVNTDVPQPSTMYEASGPATGGFVKTDKYGAVLEDTEDAPPYVGMRVPMSYKLANVSKPGNDEIWLKQRFTPVKPYSLTLSGMTGEVDTLNWKKALYELTAQYRPDPIQDWFGYDKMLAEPKEGFLHGTARGLVNFIPYTLGSAVAGGKALFADSLQFAGSVMDDQSLKDLGRDMFDSNRKTFEDFVKDYTWSYGPNGDNAGENMAGNVFGQILPSMALSLLTGPVGFGLLAGAEALGNGYSARVVAADRGLSTKAAVGAGLAAGVGTGLIGASTRFVAEPMAKSMFKPAMGMTKAMLEDPKAFSRALWGRNMLIGAYDAMTEPAQDLWAQWLGQGEITNEDWEQAAVTLMFGLLTGGLLSGLKVKSDKRSFKEHVDFVDSLWNKNAELIENIKQASGGKITDEVLNDLHEYLRSENAINDGAAFVKMKLVENFDKFTSLSEEQKQSMIKMLDNMDVNVSLDKEMAVVDNSIDEVLSYNTDMTDTQRDMFRNVVRGIAQMRLLYEGIMPSQWVEGAFSILRTGDTTGMPFTDANGAMYLGQQRNDVRRNVARSVDTGVNTETTSGMVAAEARKLAAASKNASMEQSKAAGLTAHELWHWVERETGLTNVAAFMDEMQKFVDNVLPGITSGKTGVAKSEAYAYAMQYAKDLKPILGLSGDTRSYMDLFNAVSNASTSARQFADYRAFMKALIQENAGIIDDILAGYGTDELRANVRQFAKTGDWGTMSAEDIKALDNVMNSLIDSKTATKLGQMFPSSAVAESFLDRYAKDYDESVKKDVALAQDATARYNALLKEKQLSDAQVPGDSNVAKTGAVVQTKLEEEVQILDAQEDVEQPSEQAGEKAGEQVSEQPAESTEPTKAKYSGETIELKKPQTVVERFVAGEEFKPQDIEDFVASANNWINKALGMIPAELSVPKFSLNDFSDVKFRKSYSGKELAATVVPMTEAGKKLASAIPANHLNMFYQAVARAKLFLQHTTYYSIENDISWLESRMPKSPEVVNSEERRAMGLRSYNDNELYAINVAKETVDSLSAISDRIAVDGFVSEDSYRRYIAVLENFRESLRGVDQGLYSWNAIESKIDYVKRSMADALVLDPMDDEFARASEYNNLWLSYNEDKPQAVETTRKLPVTRTLQNVLAENPNEMMGRTSIESFIERGDLPEGSTLEGLENALRERGVEPIAFNVEKITLPNGKEVKVPQFLTNAESGYETITGDQLSAMRYGEARTPINVRTVEEIFNKYGYANKTGLFFALLDSIQEQMPKNISDYSIDMKMKEICAIARAAKIADFVFQEYQALYERFNVNPTIGVGAGDAEISWFNSSPVAKRQLSQALSDGYYPVSGILTFWKPGTKVAFTKGRNYKYGVVTYAGRTPSSATHKSEPFYVVRYLEGADKHAVDIVWSYNEFKKLMDAGVPVLTGDRMSSSEFKEMLMMPIESGVDYTGMAVDMALRKEYIKHKNAAGEVVDAATEAEMAQDVWDNKEDKYYASETDVDLEPADFIIADTENMPAEIAEQFEAINAYESASEEFKNFIEQKQRENEARPKVERWANQLLPGLKKSRKQLLMDTIDLINNRKHSKALYFMTRGAGLEQQLRNIGGDELVKTFKLNEEASKAQQFSEEFKRNMQSTLIENVFNKSETEFVKWVGISGANLRNVKATMADGSKRDISRAEIMSLYGAKLLAETKTKDGRFFYPVSRIDGGNVELYERLRSQYTNADELLGQLTKEDMAAEKALIEMAPLLRNQYDSTPGVPATYFLPVVDIDAYGVDGWANRYMNQRIITGSQLLDPSKGLALPNAYKAMVQIATRSGIRKHNFLERVGVLNDMLNMNAINEGDERFKIMDDTDVAALSEIQGLSRQLRDLLEKELGASNFVHLLKSVRLDSNYDGVGEYAKSKAMDVFQRITRSAMGSALSLKPKQAVTNLFGNYMVMSGLSDHSGLRYQTVDFLRALANFRSAWELAMTNPELQRRFKQAGLSEQFERLSDMQKDSFFQDLSRIAAQHGKDGIGSVLSAIDAFAKKATKYGIGLTNSFPDVVGLALAYYNVHDTLYAQAMQQLQQNRSKIAMRDTASIQKQAESLAADMFNSYMLTHVSSSNYMARGFLSKWLAKHGLEAIAAFTNDTLQKSASLANAVSDLMNTTDPATRQRLMKEISGIVTSNVTYAVVQAGLLEAALRVAMGVDLSDKEKEYLRESMLRESVAQLTGAFQLNSLTQSMTDAIFFNKSTGMNVMPIPEIVSAVQKALEGKPLEAALAGASLAGIAPAQRAGQLVEAIMQLTGDDYERAVGRRRIFGRSENASLKMLGLRKDSKTGKYKKTKSRKKEE